MKVTYDYIKLDVNFEAIVVIVVEDDDEAATTTDDDDAMVVNVFVTILR